MLVATAVATWGDPLRRLVGKCRTSRARGAFWRNATKISSCTSCNYSVQLYDSHFLSH